MKTRAEITVETERIVVLSQTKDTPIRWCDGCAAERVMLTLGEVESLTNIAPRAIIELAAAGRVHFDFTDQGKLLVCPTSPAF